MIRNRRTQARGGALLALVATATSLLATAAPAGAVTVQSTSPADGARVQPPATIEAVYDLGLHTTASTITVENGNGNTVGGARSFATDTVPNDTIVFTPSGTLTEAGSPYTVTVHAEDALGVTPDADTEWSFVVDTTDPATPTITSVTNPVNQSNVTAVTVVGTAEPDSTVDVTLDDVGNPGSTAVTASTTAAGNGAYSVPLNASNLSNGTLDVTVTATDEAGNESPEATDQTTKDTSVPAVPGVTIDDDPITAANQGAVDISGTSGEEGITILLSVDDAGRPDTTAVTTSTTTGDGGAWSVSMDLSTLAQGTITASARARDAVGNTSTPATDTAAKELGAPELVDTSPAGGSSVQPPAEITVTYDEALDTGDSTIVVTDDTETPLAGATTFRDFNRTIVFTPTSTLTQGGSPYTVTAAVEDVANNPLNPDTEFSFTVDATAPAAPTITSATDPVNAANQTVVQVGGQAETGSTVEVTISDTQGGEVSDTVEASSPYSVSLDVTSLEDGTLSVVATATDEAGNTSADSATTEITKDTVAPAAPTISAATDPVNSGNATTMAVSGTAEAGSTVEVTVEDGLEATVSDTTTATGGTWSVELDVSGLADGTLTVSATATDAVGNTSDESAPTEVTKDTGAPAAPVITDAEDPVLPSNAGSFTVTGTSADGTDIDVTVEDEDGTDVAGSTTGTSWSLNLNVTGLDAGTLTVTATATDANGNTSSASAPFEVTKVPFNVDFQSVAFNTGGDRRPFTGDFDGDGPDDIFWYAPGTATDSLWLSDGDGTFTPRAMSVSGTYFPIAGDFDGDGDDDVFWYAAGSTADHLWLSDGDGTFTSRPVSVSGTYFPVAGDFDGDDDDDIVWYGPGSTADSLWLADGDGTFTPRSISVSGSYVPVVGDFDSDGVEDIFWYGPGTNPDSVWLGDGDGTFTKVAARDDGVYRPLVGDFNADGQLDLFKYRPGSGVEQLVLRQVGTRTYSVGGTYRTAVGDFDDDGDADILWYAPGTATDHLWFAVPRT